MSFAGWAEFFFIFLLAFVVVGPKDLPKLMFMLARFVQGLRRLSSEFMVELEIIQHVKEVEEKQVAQGKKRFPSSHAPETGEPEKNEIIEEK